MRCAGRRWLRALPWMAALCIAVGCTANVLIARHEKTAYQAVYTICAFPVETADEWQHMRMLAGDCQLLTQTEVFRQAVLAHTPSDGNSCVTVRAQPGTHMLTLTATGPDAAIVQGLANAAGEELVERIPRMFAVSSAQEVERAALPEAPLPSRARRQAAAAAAGVLALCSLLVCLFGSDRRLVHFDLPEAEAFCLGAIADTRRAVRRFARNKQENGMLLYQADRLIKDNVRRLILRLRRAEQRCLVLCGLQTQEESAAEAVLLASEMAQQGYRVLLMEMNCDQPQLAALLKVKARADLHDYLLCRAEWPETVVRTGLQTLTFVDWLHDDADVAGMAATEAFRAFLQSAREHFDWVLLHAAPAMECADAAMLSVVADGVVLMAQDGRYDMEEIEEAARQQAAMGRPARGVVFTGVQRSRLNQTDSEL